MDVVAEENQEECLGIQNQEIGEVQVSVEAEVSHFYSLAKRRAAKMSGVRRRKKARCES